MPNPILLDRDRKVRVFSNGTPVSVSPLQSVYAKYLNFIGLTVTENAPLGAYDVTAGATTDELVKAYINGTQIGTVARKLNFSSDFTGTEDAGNNRFNIGLPASTLLPDGTTTTKPRIGTLYGGALQGNGLFAGITMNGDGAITSSLDTSTMYTLFTSGGTDNDLAGFSTPSFISRMAYNPTFRVRFKTTLSTESLFIGFLSSTSHPVGDTTPLDGVSGAAFGYDDATDANFVAWHNNGAGTAQKTNSGVAKNNTIHTLTISLDTAASRVTITLDGTTFVNSTTAPPATATNLCIHCNNEEVGTSVTDFSIDYAWLAQDK